MKLIENVKGLKDIFGDDFGKYAREQLRLIKLISEHIDAIHSNVDQMIDVRKEVNQIEDAPQKAEAYCNKIKPFFDEIRYHCDNDR